MKTLQVTSPKLRPFACLVLGGIGVGVGLSAATIEKTDAQSPLRPPPELRHRDLAGGPSYFVDARQGSDRNDGSKDRPWQSIGRAVKTLAAGDTLYLRGGVYHERLNLTHSGSPGRPITVRGFPGEMAVIDGGIREFLERPAEAWEPYAGGTTGEFRSTREYAAGELPADTEDDEDEPPPPGSTAAERPSDFFKRNVQVRGWFASSMIPVRGYTEIDFRAPDTGLWMVKHKFSQDSGVYFGPGVWYNRATRRIHIRLSHTAIPGITNYAGETDPRKLPLVIAVRPPGGPNAGVSEDGGPRAGVLNLQGARHWRFQDLVVRGSADALINVDDSEGIELDHLTIYGAPGLSGARTNGLRVVHSAFRGLTSPWESRASMKYRGAGAYIIRHANERDQLTSRDWEVANCEVTDSHDGVWMLGIKNLKFHHNYVDNFNDDGLEYGLKVKGQEIYIYENLISRCNGTFALHAVGNNPSPGSEWRGVDPGAVDPASGVYVYRNVIDLRGMTYRGPPRQPGGSAEHERTKLWGPHGDGGAWPQLFFYQNTVVASGVPAPWLNSYGFGAGARGASSQRRTFNNIFVRAEGRPHFNLSSDPKAPMPDNLDVEVDGNLHWSLAMADGESSRRPAQPPIMADWKGRKTRPGFMARDLLADPRFARLSAEGEGPMDLRLQPGSPAVDSGVKLPGSWPDSLRDQDSGAPDIGALPAGAALPRVGIDGRMSLCPGTEVGSG